MVDPATLQPSGGGTGWQAGMAPDIRGQMGGCADAHDSLSGTICRSPRINSAQRHPTGAAGAVLALDPDIIGLVGGQDVVLEAVQYIVALVGDNGQHRMT